MTCRDNGDYCGWDKSAVKGLAATVWTAAVKGLATEAEEKAEILRDRFRLSAVSIVESEVKKQGMEIAEPVVACVADLAFKFTEQLARDVELFAQHAGRKSVNMEDVIISAHRNEHLVGLLRSFAQELKGKEPAIEKKRKRSSKKKQSPDEGEFSAL
ncbi:MHF histone-fold complex subunit 1 [Asparagus officinalis]|uniref:MHF histone-fold complex subunit 1 n=1 Tax=Asparagus officinalis TaxID=4686 RepID=UPI00098E764A|nr:MHF histone-fold complex subunit 1 [Asparagus officinalis]